MAALGVRAVRALPVFAQLRGDLLPQLVAKLAVEVVADLLPGLSGKPGWPIEAAIARTGLAK